MVAQAGSAPADPAAVVRWARSAADLLAADDDDLDDLMITSRRSYRLVRLLDGGELGPLLLHVCLDRNRANLAVARRELSRSRLEPEPVHAPPPAVIPEQAAPATWAPLPRRVPAAIPPAAPWVPPVRASRWPSRSRPGVLATAGYGGSVVPAPRTAAAVPDAPPAAAAGAAPPATGWADDIGTMRRLLAGLRSLRE
ncbi:hypothetical protein PHY01_00070 [Pseudonocardia hydrocarbonoxydans]|uniref:Uncharacterized protein n=1 Tax=Pseudonocardia hydrocarbonoxydans TaxID=76726 RepID=A0A4Y3WFS6_9PSEU|nr:hypothetical protein [Pseudonocardia hydrocarbonoxydans]GEC17724.1 hypothetical protein PHY01_00070 [Pseudonocardia hydrocarbonoxydans]